MTINRLFTTLFAILVLLFFGFFFSCQNFDFTQAATGTDNVRVNLYINGRNNNGVCEPITGEDILTCPADCTPPPPSSSGGTGYFPPEEIDITPPQNPLNVNALGVENGILLTWTNPPDEDFSYVRIMRNENQFYGDPFIGKLIYEGVRQYFLDKNVIAGKKYFYTFFSRDITGNFSGGSAAWAIFNPKEKIPTKEKDEEQIVIKEIPKYLVHQYNKQVKPFSFNIPAEVNNIDNIIIDTETLVFSNDYLIVENNIGEKLGQYMFSFNRNSGRYESIIPPLKNEGLYLVTIFRYDEGTPKILTKGLIQVEITPTVSQIKDKGMCKIFDYDIVIYIGYLLLLIALTLILKHTSKENKSI